MRRLYLLLAKLFKLHLWQKPSPALGLMFNEDSLQMLLLSGSPTAYQVEEYREVPLPEGCIVQKKIKAPDQIIEALRALVASLTTACRDVVIALPDEFVITKQISLINPGLSDHALEAEILFEAAKALPLPLENVSLDYHLLGPTEGASGKVDILLIAARNGTLEEYLNILTKAGLTARVIDVESYVLGRALETTGLIAPTTTAMHVTKLALRGCTAC